jgi:hypothetical protein
MVEGKIVFEPTESEPSSAKGKKGKCWPLRRSPVIAG